MVILAGLTAACGNAPPGQFGAGGGQAPGVTSNTVQVGGLAAVSGPLGDQFSPVFAGAQAYFDMVNAAGGVHGRRIELVAKLDDGTDPGTDVAQARALVEADQVFAVVPVATPVFSGGTYLAAQDVPTFGYNINPQWSPGRSMFGQDGSYLNPAAIDVAGPWLAKQLHLRKIAILAYTVTQSSQCAQGQAASFRKFGLDVVLTDSSLPIGVPDLSGDVARIKAAGAQMVVSCLDASGSTSVSTALQRAGLASLAQYWISGYDPAELASFPSQYQGVYLTTDFVPFQEASLSPALRTYLGQMHRHFPQAPVGQVSLAGWISAAMFVKGLDLAGRDLTRHKLVAAVNSLTHFNAGGIETPVNWHDDHTGGGPVNCSAYIRAQQGRFIPVFQRPFVCLSNRAANLAQLHPVTPPGAVAPAPGG